MRRCNDCGKLLFFRYTHYYNNLKLCDGCYRKRKVEPVVDLGDGTIFSPNPKDYTDILRGHFLIFRPKSMEEGKFYSVKLKGEEVFVKLQEEEIWFFRVKEKKKYGRKGRQTQKEM